MLNRFTQVAKAFTAEPTAARLAWQVRRQKLSYLDHAALMDLHAAVKGLDSAEIDGCILELGCALGGSTIMIANAKQQQRPFFVYDTFETIPPPTDNDSADAHARYEAISQGDAVGIKGDAYYGYQGDLLPRVTATLSEFGTPTADNNIHLVKGLYEDTLQVDKPVALAHIDCDWYDSVWVCLERIVPKLVVGGTLVIDDYYDWDGCKRAVNDYFAEKRDGFAFLEKSRLHIQKL